MKYYAVAKGRKTGIFTTWNETKELVNGYHGAKYKSFKTLKEAQEYINLEITHTNLPEIPNSEMFQTNLPKIPNLYTIYTDGSCINKIGGYGFVIIFPEKEANQDYPMKGKVPYDPCTNQIAELYAIYQALLYYISDISDISDISSPRLHIYTDSKYSIGCLSEWYGKWIKNNWTNSKGDPVANSDLIKSILSLLSNCFKHIDIKFFHVKAHNGDFYNEWADRLANEGRFL